MQEQQNEFPQEGRNAPRRERSEREIISFQELPPSSLLQVERMIQLFIGIAIGCIPLALFSLAVSNFLDFTTSKNLYAIALYSYPFLWVVAIACLCVPRVRFVGFGLVMMAIVSPVLWAISYDIRFQH